MMSQRIPNGTPRKILNRAQRQRLLAAYHRSGLSQKAFTQRHGIGYSTLTQWLRKERTQCSPEVQAPALGLTEVKVDGVMSSTSAWIEVINPQGWMVRAPAWLPATTLSQLLRELPC